MDLHDRVAVVTGGSTGIGRATAARLAAAGCRVAICARTVATLEATASELRADGAEVVAIPADVAREEEVGRLRDTVQRKLGAADVLVNNAGVAAFGRVDELTLGDYERVFDVNVRGLFLCTRAFAPAMVERRDGVIVNIASLAGKNAFAGGAIYAGSKHAVMGMSKSMMLDLRPHNVRVLTICPGSVDTPFFDKQSFFQPAPDRALTADIVAELIASAIRLSDRATVSESEIRAVNP